MSALRARPRAALDGLRRRARRSAARVAGQRLRRGACSGFFGEALRQAGILITGSVLIVLGLVFVLGLQCGHRGRVRGRGRRRAVVGRRDHGAVRPARGHALRVRLHDGREGRHRHRRRARLDADLRRDRRARGHGPRLGRSTSARRGCSACGWCCRSSTSIAVVVGFVGSYLVGRRRSSGRSRPGGYLQLFWQFQNPRRPRSTRRSRAWRWRRSSCSSAATTATTRAGGPVGVGRATAKSMVVNIIGIHAIGLLGTQLFWGGNPRAPIGG